MRLVVVMVAGVVILQVLLSFGRFLPKCECDTCECSMETPLGECPCGYSCKCRYAAPVLGDGKTEGI